jgi:hypothetical protein
MTRTSPVKPVRALAVVATSGLVSAALVDAAQSVASIQQAGYIGSIMNDPISVDLEAVRSNDHLIQTLGQAHWVSIALAAGAFVGWLFQVRRNAAIIDDTHHRWGMPWLVFGWVVPIAFLWIPRQIVGEIWETSAPTDPIRGRKPGTGLVSLWWAFYLIAFPISNVITQAFDGSSSIDALRVHSFLVAALSLTGIIAAAAAIAVVWRISRFQEQQSVRIDAALAVGTHPTDVLDYDNGL